MTGGFGSEYLDSLETLDSEASSWVTSGAKLPQPLYSAAAANIDNRVLIFGNYTLFIKIQDITGT